MRPPEAPTTPEHIGELVAGGVALVDELRLVVDQLGDREVTGAVWDAQRALRSAHAHITGALLPSGRPEYVLDGSEMGFTTGRSLDRAGCIEVIVEDNAVDFVLVATPATMTAVGLMIAAETAGYLAGAEVTR